jgi:hypothetical protein
VEVVPVTTNLTLLRINGWQPYVWEEADSCALIDTGAPGSRDEKFGRAWRRRPTGERGPCLRSCQRGTVRRSLARNANQNSAIVAVSAILRPVISSIRWIRYTTVWRCTPRTAAVRTQDLPHCK